MQTCGPRAKESCARVLRAAGVEDVGVGEDGGVAVGAGERDPDQVAAAMSAPGELDVGGGVAVDDRRGGLHPQRLLDDGGQEDGVGGRARWTSVRSRCATALRIMPSVVSMPPNIITAAFDDHLLLVSVPAAPLSSDPPSARACRGRAGQRRHRVAGLVGDVAVGLRAR